MQEDKFQREVGAMQDYFMPIWPVLFLLIPFTISGLTLYYGWGWWEGRTFSADWWFTLIMPIFIGILINILALVTAIGAGVGLGHLLGNRFDQVWHEIWRAKLATLRNSEGVSGNIGGGLFLLSGQIGSTEVYYYYEDLGNGAYRPHHWRVNRDVMVHEEDRPDAEVYQFDCRFKRGSWVSFFAIPCDRIRMDFHIPKGSLVHQYSLK